MVNTFPPLISASSYDHSGLQQMFGNGATASFIIRAENNDYFFNPSLGLTGFSYEGKHYINGVYDPSVVASWATEGAGYSRSDVVEFPREAAIISSDSGLTIFDQTVDPFTVWMSFIQGDTNAYLNNFVPTVVLDTGTVSLDAGAHSIIRKNGSWLEDGVAIGDSLILSGFVDNNLMVTVTGYSGSDGIIVEETVVSEVGSTDVGIVRAFTYSQLNAKAIQYTTGKVTVSFIPDSGSMIGSSIFLHIDFSQDKVYADFNNPY